MSWSLPYFTVSAAKTTTILHILDQLVLIWGYQVQQRLSCSYPLPASQIFLNTLQNLLENNLGPLALSSTPQSPVVIHDVLKFSFTSIIDDEGSWAGQTLGNFSTTSWIWMTGKQQTLGNSRSGQWMGATAHWLLHVDQISPPDASPTKACLSSPAAGSHSPSMTAHPAGRHNLPASSYHHGTPTHCTQLCLVQGTISCGISPLVCWLLQSRQLSRNALGLTACPAPGQRPHQILDCLLALPDVLGRWQEPEHKPTPTFPRRLPALQATACAIFHFSATVVAEAVRPPSLPCVASSCAVLWAWVIELCSHSRQESRSPEVHIAEQ